MFTSASDVNDGPPDQCQYHNCTDDPTGALGYFFGTRWFCMTHYTHMVTVWNGDKPEIVSSPGATDGERDE
jgi:hypothetical protein